MSSSTTGGAMGQPSDYDYSTHDNQVVAVYATDGEAQAAKASLLSNGFPASAVQVVSRDTAGMATTGSDTVVPGSTDAGLWGAVRSLFVPDEDRNSYTHAIGHGHAMLVVTPTAGMDRGKLMHVLEGTNPVDFDAKLEEWRTSGYDYSQPHEHYAATSQAMGGAAPVGFASGTGGAMAGSTSTGPVGGTVAADTMSGATGQSMPSQPAPSQPVTGTVRMDPSASDTATAPRPMAASTATANTATAGTTAASMDTAARTADDETLKVVEERLRVGKREVAAGAVRIRSYVVERPVEEQVRLREERVVVERHPVDRPATAADMAAFQERTLEARATSEEAVVNKEARVVEEIGLRKEATERTETVRDTVRKTEVEVEDGTKLAGTPPTTPRP